MKAELGGCGDGWVFRAAVGQETLCIWRRMVKVDMAWGNKDDLEMKRSGLILAGIVHYSFQRIGRID